LAQVGISFHPSLLPWLNTAPSGVGCVEIIAERFFGSAQGLARVLGDRFPLIVRTRRSSLLSPQDEDAPVAPVVAFVRDLGARWICDHLGFRYASGLDLGGPCPAPLDAAALERVAARVRRIMDDCGARFLIRNVASPIAIGEPMQEPAFLDELCARTGAGISLDATALLVNARNHRFDARRWLGMLDRAHVVQVHAGGCRLRDGRWDDTHDGPMDDELWALLADVLDGCAADIVTLQWEGRFPPSAAISETLHHLEALARVNEPTRAGS
jgi:uncharacterized protein